MPLMTQLSQDHTRHTIFLSGSFDITKADLFRHAYHGLPVQVSHVDVDLGDVDSIDVAAMGMLFMLVQELGESVEIRLLNCSNDFTRLLHLYGFDRLLAIHTLGDELLRAPQGDRAVAG